MTDNNKGIHAVHHAVALRIVGEESSRVLSRNDFELCMRIAKRALGERAESASSTSPGSIAAFFARLFAKKARPTSSRDEWSAAKSIAREAGDTHLLAVLAEAEQQALDTIADMHGAAAVILPTGDQIEEMRRIALRIASR